MKYWKKPRLYSLNFSTGNGVIVRTKKIKEVIEAVKFWDNNWQKIVKIECFDGTRWVEVTGEFALHIHEDIAK